MSSRLAIHTGLRAAAVLAGAWRCSPPPLHLTLEELEEVAPFLLGSGGGALTWWRLHQLPLLKSNRVEQIQQAYRLHTVQALHHEHNLRQVISHLRQAGVDPLLSKGWSTARLYPEAGLRPYGDFDLGVHPSQLAATAGAVNRMACKYGWIDLHEGVPDLPDRTWDQVRARSVLLTSGDVHVRVLCAEDQLRQMCLHLLRHGAWRPIWLCDVGAALEACPANFDWDYCLSGEPRLSDWVICAVGLARQLLGARVAHLPVAQKCNRLPSWVVTCVLRQWGAGKLGDSHSNATRPMADCLRRPAFLLQDIARRWPSAVEAVMKLRGSPGSRVPKWFFQVAYGLKRLAQFASHKSEVRSRGKSRPTFDLHVDG